MVGTPRLFVDGKCALGERLGVGVAALALVQGDQVTERLCHVRVVGTQSALGDGKRSSVVRLGLDIAALLFVEEAEPRERRRVFEARLAIGLTRQGHGLSSQGDSISVPASTVKGVHLPKELVDRILARLALAGSAVIAEALSKPAPATIASRNNKIGIWLLAHHARRLIAGCRLARAEDALLFPPEHSRRRVDFVIAAAIVRRRQRAKLAAADMRRGIPDYAASLC